MGGGSFLCGVRLSFLLQGRPGPAPVPRPYPFHHCVNSKCTPTFQEVQEARGSLWTSRLATSKVFLPWKLTTTNPSLKICRRSAPHGPVPWLVLELLKLIVTSLFIFVPSGKALCSARGSLIPLLEALRASFPITLPGS